MRKGSCSVCDSVHCGEINALLSRGAPASELQGRFGMARSCFQRHVKHSALLLEIKDKVGYLRWAVQSANGDDCILWPFSTSGQMGYGSLRMGLRSTVYAHRMAYELAYGPIPPGKLVMHSCDTPLCFNPRHLSVGTNADNSNDKVAKMRSLCGESNPMSKLTSEQVLAIRREYRAGVAGYGQDAIGKRYGVTRVAIRKIVKGEAWKRVQQ